LIAHRYRLHQILECLRTALIDELHLVELLIAPDVVDLLRC
jgi:hypothetical protein